MNKLIAILILGVAALFGQEAPKTDSRLTDVEIQAVNQATQASQLADVQKQLADLKQQVVIMKACWTRGIKPEDCQIQADGTFKTKGVTSPQVPEGTPADKPKSPSK